MGKIIFILGGSRSVKSSYAVKLAAKLSKDVLFVATAKPQDKEMQIRIKLHKKNRPSHWKTIEEPRSLGSVVKSVPKRFNLIVIDCLTLFISNLLEEGFSDKDIEVKILLLLKMFKKSNFKSILVSNEVGLAIVPANPLARRFRDLAGRINQMVAKKADEVDFIVAGLPFSLKSLPVGKE